MDIALNTADGDRLDARVEVVALPGGASIILHSRGGSTGGRPARNPEYAQALQRIFALLALDNILPQRVLLDSAPHRNLRTEDRLLIGMEDMAGMDDAAIVKLVRREMQTFGQEDGTKGGNSTKRLRIDVNIDPRRIAEILGSTSPSASLETDDLLGTPAVPDEDRKWAENDRRAARHLRRERASGLAEAKRAAFTRQHGRLHCERCQLVPSEELGEHGDAVVEVHHRVPLADLDQVTETTLEDLECLCANCHRITHRELRAFKKVASK
mgnify:CR=1 FL=1